MGGEKLETMGIDTLSNSFAIKGMYKRGIARSKL